jgi:spermidine/putrescine transport system substrate-binding protein
MRRLMIVLVLLVLPIAGCSKAETPQVNVYMYSEYIDPELPGQFERETGIRLRLDVYEMTEEMMAKLQQAGGVSEYDVVVVSDHAISMLTKLGLLQPLDLARIPNAANVRKEFRNPGFDPEGRYSLPYQWGTVGLMYRKSKLPDPEPTWSLLFDAARQPNSFVLMDSLRDMVGIALKYQGHSLNSRNPAELKAAGELLLKAKKSDRCLGFEGGVGGMNKVLAGAAVLAVVYNGDAVRVAADDDDVAFLLPKEGSVIWFDSMTIPAKAPHVDYAHKFMNFILDARVGAKLSNFNRYATPNEASLPLITPADLGNPAIYPTAEQMKTLECVEDVGDDTRLYDEVWTAVKSR